MWFSTRSAQLANSEQSTPFQPTTPTTQTASHTTTNVAVLTGDLTQQTDDDVRMGALHPRAGGGSSQQGQAPG